jgi:4-hydroxybenzoate polyprenyltransferase
MDSSDKEFLRALHEEKIRTQTERADYITKKLAFITVLFGLSSVNLGSFTEIFWLLYLIPLISICYDLYIMSADSRIKRIGTFLGRHPGSNAGEAEKQWEKFCIDYRDGLAPSANMFFSILVTMAAAVFIRTQQLTNSHESKFIFAVWLVASVLAIILLWCRHRDIIRKIGEYESDQAKKFDISRE